MTVLFDDLFIFEMANNHQGDISHALKIVKKLGEVSNKYKINAEIKLQYRDLDTMIHPDYKNRKDVKHIPRFLSTRLSPDDFKIIVDEIRNQGLHTICTPFDEISVDLCVKHGIEILKVASASALDWPLLEKISTTGKPVIISTGGKTYEDLDKVYNFMIHRDIDFAMLHCVGMYPVKPEDIQANCIDQMKLRYKGIPIGYSGHEDPNNYTPAILAVAKGATIFERHVGLATETIKLNSYSTDVNDVNKWIEAIINSKKMCGIRGIKNITASEIQSMNELARGCYAKNPIKKGNKILRKDVYFAMPCTIEGQTTSGTYNESMVSSKNYDVNEPIIEIREESIGAEIRSYIRKIKSMLYEAQIPLATNSELELSHHYGLNNFNKVGAAIITVINREYCKKLIIQLPNQKHPTHYHKEKEESFQILSGVLELTINGQKMICNIGDVITVERGKKHSFSSNTGCIFEEISTTHIKNDSYYDDPDITSKDIIERKTILKEW